MSRRTRAQGGFTVIEFMVATLVFSTVLLGTTFAIIQISRIYQRSLNDSKTQAATRNLIDTVAQSIQFSGSSETVPVTVPANTNAICLGNRQYVYVLGRQISDDLGITKSKHGFITRQSDSCAITEDIITTTPVDGNPSELLSKGMRLVSFSVTPSTAGLYTVSARVAYGDDDLLCIPSEGNCSNIDDVLSDNKFMNTDIRCKTGIGSQFCSVSELTTTVQRRLQ
jgi:type II secretory pathway pseudopilin PulG